MPVLGVIRAPALHPRIRVHTSTIGNSPRVYLLGKAAALSARPHIREGKSRILSISAAVDAHERITRA